MKKKRRDFNYAYHCLEQWVLWNTEHNGFPVRSTILKLGEMAVFSSSSNIPTGVESNDRDVERANLILAMMNDAIKEVQNKPHGGARFEAEARVRRVKDSKKERIPGKLQMLSKYKIKVHRAIENGDGTVEITGERFI